MRTIFLTILLTALVLPLAAQRVVSVDDVVEQHLFSYDEIFLMEDTSGLLTLDEVRSKKWADAFVPNAAFSPVNKNRESTYWFRIRIRADTHQEEKHVLEFFDQTIDRLRVYVPTGSGYKLQLLGDNQQFSLRNLWHKNFIVPLEPPGNGIITCYIAVTSLQRADVLIVLRSASYLFHYALDEYFFFGIFYGMILVFSFYNLIMLIAVREAHYFYYILYLVCVGLYEMSADGIGFQYLWPSVPPFNYYSSGLFLYLATSFAMVFSSSVLNLRRDLPFFYRLFLFIFAARTVFLLVTVFLAPEWFSFRFVEIIPFSTIYLACLWSLLKQKYSPALYLSLAYTVVAFGIVYKVSQYLGFEWSPLGGLSHYSLGFSFIAEMLLLSFAISDKIRLLRREKEEAQLNTIDQLHENQRLKDDLNQTLEIQVADKTRELVMKSQLIEEQNGQLQQAYGQLARQAAEIEQINQLLEKDNERLQHDVAEEKEARVLSKELGYEEFCAMHPTDESWMKFLADLKWENGYKCIKCRNQSHGTGKSPHSCRCSKCGYEESVIANTLLQNTHLPLSKALYMIFLVYNSQGTISSHKLSKVLGIRQSTCWAYSSKIKEAMKFQKSQNQKPLGGWNSIILKN